MKDRKRRRSAGLLLLVLFLIPVMSCEKQAAQEVQESKLSEEKKDPLVGLILTSQDAEENEALIARFQEEAEAAGAGLQVMCPEVTEKEAKEAAALTDSFVICDADPIELQMLQVNELVAKDADVIAIHANHGEALEPILTAARAVGVKVCAFGQEVNEESRDVYADTEEAAQAAFELLNEGNAG